MIATPSETEVQTARALDGTASADAASSPGIAASVEAGATVDELGKVLREVNRIRVEHGADPLYELPKGRPAFDPDSTCVLQNAFADMGIAYVDYSSCIGAQLRFNHSLGPFIRKFDAGRYPQLIGEHGDRAASSREPAALSVRAS